ncbi:MAG: amylo-alpha-1,6-glucosidase [Chloroflexi bacterium]|nr:amylo-alpha-1,6-glucosidase [Chloroflexota bacterium]
MTVADDLIIAEHGVFLISSTDGTIPGKLPGHRGLYYRDTRFLSGLVFLVEGEAPPLLSVDERGFAATLIYGAPDAGGEHSAFPRELLIERQRGILVAGNGASPLLQEALTLTTYGRRAIDLDVRLLLCADFSDMFAVRGIVSLPPPPELPVVRSESETLVFTYRGRDKRVCSTTCTFSPRPAVIAVDGQQGSVSYRLHLEPRVPLRLNISVTLDEGGAEPPAPVQVRSTSFGEMTAQLEESHREWRDTLCTRIETGHAAWNAAIAENLRCLRLLLLEEPAGPYMAAGIPWFAVPFGRDALIVALQMLTVYPALAASTLRFLAAHQGQTVNPWRDEEPGKILHELRVGESVRIGLAPFGPYYGSVDATPLFLVLLRRYCQWVEDQELLQELEPAVRAAVTWLDQYGDPDQDGYIEFSQKAERGIANQGWKDSGDSLQFPDGSYPQAPIALVEVQGYAYEARLAAALVFRRTGDERAAAEQERKATALRRQFNRDFWMEQERYLAQALDATKHQVPAVTSNAGHCLWSGILDEDKAGAIAVRLLARDMHSGWGIRTLSMGYPSYNPLSYHNGSVWPHDTSLVIAGLKRYGHDRAAAALAEEVIAAAQGYRFARLPELYAGLPKREGDRAPIPYPVACSPQAWASGSVFLILESIAGLEADVQQGIVRIRPALPREMGMLRFERLRVGGRQLSLEIREIAPERLRITGTWDSGAAFRRFVRVGEPVTLHVR